MARRLLNKLRRAAGLTATDWRYLGIAVFELLRARVRFGREPVTKILKELQQQSAPSQGRAGPQVNLARLSWAIGAAAARVPWRSDCLLQAMAADRWLRRYGLSPQFFLGAQIPGPGRFQAHAWLYCNGLAVTGGTGEDFTTLLEPGSSLLKVTRS
jgi:Transglutaminase-like superfamily